jgi:hypothetical protein
MEMCFCLAIKAGLVGGEYDPSNTMLWRDWFYPFPMHGMAVILIGVALYPLWHWLVGKTSPFIGSAISFVCNGIACGTIEFVCGLMWNADLQNWDYTPMPFNFMGQVCLQNAIGFGLASSVIAWWLYPTMERMIARVRPAVMNIVCVVVAIAGGILFSLYAISPPEGIDLGKAPEATAEQQAQDEMSDLSTTVELISRSNGGLQQLLDGSTSVPQGVRDDVRYHSDNIEKELEQIRHDLGK